MCYISPEDAKRLHDATSLLTDEKIMGHLTPRSPGFPKVFGPLDLSYSEFKTFLPATSFWLMYY